jgi:hypothetical protein
LTDIVAYGLQIHIDSRQSRARGTCNRFPVIKSDDRYVIRYAHTKFVQCLYSAASKLIAPTKEGIKMRVLLKEILRRLSRNMVYVDGNSKLANVG